MHTSAILISKLPMLNFIEAGGDECPRADIEDALSSTHRVILETSVSLLYEMKLRVEAKIKENNLDASIIKGKIGLRSGMLFAFINANTADKPEAIAKFRSAVKEVLNLHL